MRIAIIGGGVSGLVAAYRLSSSHNITIYEKSHEIGGLLRSYQREHYSIERYYHHFFSGDKNYLQLIDELGLSHTVLWLKGSTGTFQNGKIYPLTTPFEILKYPHLSLYDKFRLGYFIKKSKQFSLSLLDTVSAEQFLIDQVGEKIYSSFFKPLINSKFGKNAQKISAAWIVSRVSIRSDRSISGERLGYLSHGFSGFVNRLSSSITQQGGVILTGVTVHQVRKGDGMWYINGEPYDCVIWTGAPALLQKAGITIPDIPYQGAACVTLGMKRQVTQGIYWINLYDTAPYGAVIGHTCLTPESWYGEHLIYLASYFTGEPVHDLKNQMISDFCAKFEVHPEEIRWAEITIEPYAGPLYLAGYKSVMESIKIPGLYLAGMFSKENYPERSIEGSVSAGLRVAQEILHTSHDGTVSN